MRKILFVLALVSIISMSFKNSDRNKNTISSIIINGRDLAKDNDFKTYVNTSLDFANRVISSNSLSLFNKMNKEFLSSVEKQELASKLHFSNISALNTFLFNNKEMALRIVKKYPELSSPDAAQIINESLCVMMAEKSIDFKAKKVPICDAVLVASLGACSTVLYVFLQDGNPYNDDEALYNFANCLNASYLIYYLCEGA